MMMLSWWRKLDEETLVMFTEQGFTRFGLHFSSLNIYDEIQVMLGSAEIQDCTNLSPFSFS